MPNNEKVEKVAVLKERIEASEALLLADFRGLTVTDATDVRSSLREAGTTFAVVKNTLMKRAADEAGLADLAQFLEGPTGVAFVETDPVVAAKRFADAAKKFPALVLKGGYLEGRMLSGDEAKALASLDSREVMLSKLAGLMKGEVSRAASMFVSLQSRFVGLLDALRDKLPAEETSGESEPSEAAASLSAEAASSTPIQEAVETPGADAPDENSVAPAAGSSGAQGAGDSTASASESAGDTESAKEGKE